MHSHWYDLGELSPVVEGQEGWTFHTNGDPIPSVCLINPRGDKWKPEWPSFRATTEELMTFVLADRLQAVGNGESLRLATISIKKIMVPRGKKMKPISPAMALFCSDDLSQIAALHLTANALKERDDALELIVPYDVIIWFIDEMIDLKYQSYLEGQNEPLKSMAAIGAYVLLTNRKD